jgi:alkylated DNA repair dioxygenase AlkB
MATVQEDRFWELSSPRAEAVRSGTCICDRDGDVILYENFFSEFQSDELFQTLKTEIEWEHQYIKIFGKTNPIPRLTAWYGDPGKSYTYSRILHHPKPWTAALLDIKKQVESLAEVKFNSVLLNLYRHGRDSVDWHSDDEPELGKNPIIASVSLGATRDFWLKHRSNPDLPVIRVGLAHGSVLLMKGSTQAHWLHKVPKTRRPVGDRVNLTFRHIYS